LAEIVSDWSLLPDGPEHTMAVCHDGDDPGGSTMTVPTLDIPAPGGERAPGAPASSTPGRSAAMRRFVLHYLEMVLAMLAGMTALGVVTALGLDLPDRTGIRLVEMALWMTVPMVAWMRFRGHSLRASLEMAASMLLPAAAALALLATGLVTDGDVLVMAEHVVMFPAMLVAMVLRPADHTHGSTPRPRLAR
jgi:hypothetical protein